MIAWMIYTALVGLGAVVAARAAESLARLLRRPVRFVWVGATVFTVALAAIAPWRAHVEATRAAGSIDPTSLAIVQSSLQSVQSRVPASAAWYALAGWVLASILVTSAFAAVYVRLRRARRAWPVAELDARRVRVSPRLGPIVLGVVRPEIIVPRWVLARSADEQRMIVAHEASHVEARDPLVLGVVCALVALMPWNPAVWIILSRVRLAIELDCDARVLRGGASPRSYGSLLVDVAESASPLRFALTALSDDSSHLHQRILAMESRRPNHPLLRGVSVTLVALAGLLAACEAKVPTAAEINRMDARTAERGVLALGMAPADSGIAWTVDGVATTEAAAKAIPADRIAQMDVNKVDGRPHVFITTKPAQLTGNSALSDTLRVALQRNGMAGDTVVVRPRSALMVNTGQGGQPLLLIDGVRSSPSALEALKQDRDRIQSVEVLKGARAIERYGADAKYGVITITTRSGGSK